MPSLKGTSRVVDLDALLDRDLMLEAARLHALSRLEIETSATEGLTALPADHEQAVDLDTTHDEETEE